MNRAHKESNHVSSPAHTGRVRSLAVADSVPRIAAAYHDGTVQIWDLQTAKRLCEFGTVMSDGRLALRSDGEVCTAASWRKGKSAGIGCYRAVSGELVWHRRDIRHVQHMYFSRVTGGTWCYIDDGPAVHLDPDTGATTEVLRGVKRVFDGSNRLQQLMEHRNHCVLATSRGPFRIPMVGFAVLDAAFSPETLCLSEASGPARCFDCQSGRELWRCGREGWHMPGIWYQPIDGLFYALDFEYRTDKGRIIRFPAVGGEPEEICVLSRVRPWAMELCVSAKLIVTGDGDLIDTATGVIRGQLEFRGYRKQRPVPGK